MALIGNGEVLLLCAGLLAVAFVASGFGRRLRQIHSAGALTAVENQERESSRHLCFTIIQALAYAMEASDPNGQGHLECVQKCSLAIGRAMQLGEDDLEALRAAALLHNVGRLGIPEHILNKAGSLTLEEHEKLRTHPVNGARILAPIPFPWPVVPMVRHQAEHWDGSGYPDGLSSTAIPLGARILAVASAYSALRRLRPYRPARSADEAIDEIESRSGAQFDPAVVAAFRSIAHQLRTDDTNSVGEPADARAALNDIAAAQRETKGLYALAKGLAGALHVEAISETLLAAVREMVACDACVLFLPDESGEYLQARAAEGANARQLLGSVARVGSHLTGRAFARADVQRGTFVPSDLILRDVSEQWVAFRSTLVVALLAGARPVGTLNLYSEKPDAFDRDTERVLRLVATQAGHALETAHRFTEVQESAYTDALTGLRNARYLREFLEREINRARRDSTQLAVLYIDLDNFKPINDTFGHAAGDQALQDVAEILRAHVRNYDLAARYAGDEFIVVLGRAGRAAAETVAAKLRRGVERYGHRYALREGQAGRLGISVGMAIYPDDAVDVQDLLCKADAAMYIEKQRPAHVTAA